MPWTLTAPLILPNGTRLVLDEVIPDDISQTLTIVVHLRTPPATNYVVSRAVVLIRSDRADKLVRETLTADSKVAGALSVQRDAVLLAGAYDAAMNAWRGGANAGARRTALEAWCGANGVFDSVTLAGS